MYLLTMQVKASTSALPINQLEDWLQSVYRAVRNKINLENDLMKTHYDRRANTDEFRVGDLAWFYNPVRKKDRNPRLQRF